MRGLVNHEKRNLLAITLVYTIVICFILQYVIANDISGTADQINNFYGGIYNNYGNLFLGTLDQYYEMFIIVLMIPVSFCSGNTVSGKQYIKMWRIFNAASDQKRSDFSDKDVSQE